MQIRPVRMEVNMQMREVYSKFFLRQRFRSHLQKCVVFASESEAEVSVPLQKCVVFASESEAEVSVHSKNGSFLPQKVRQRFRSTPKMRRFCLGK